MAGPQVDRRFGGIARLYGDDALARLGMAHVCVVGIGGVGSWAVEALARSGVGRLTLIDLDHIAESNLNRQIHALDSTLGQAKVLAMKERVATINPECEVVTIDEFVTTENAATLLPACDYLVDAIDQVRPKAALIAHCRATNVPVVTTGAAGGKTDPAQIRIDDLSRTTQDPLASKLRSTLRRDYGFPRDPKKKFGVDCVYSLEPVSRPPAGIPSGHTTADQPEGRRTPRSGGPEQGEGWGNAPHSCTTAPVGLSCAGYGSSVCVTAGFGFAAASRVLKRLAAG